MKLIQEVIMGTIERKEKIKIEYDGSRIVIRGSTFKMAAPMTTMGLMGIYASGEGTTTVHLIVDVEEVKEPASEEIIVANTEPVVNTVNTEVVVEEAQPTVNTDVEVIMINPEEIVEEVKEEPVKEPEPKPEPVKEKSEFDLSSDGVSDAEVKDSKDDFDIPVKKDDKNKSEFDPFNTKGPTGDKWSTFG